MNRTTRPALRAGSRLGLGVLVSLAALASYAGPSVGVEPTDPTPPQLSSVEPGGAPSSGPTMGQATPEKQVAEVTPAALAAGRDTSFAALVRQARAQGTARVMLTLVAPPTVGQAPSLAAASATAEAGRAAVLKALGRPAEAQSAAKGALPGAPAMSVEVTARELRRLQALPQVVTASPDGTSLATGTSPFGAAAGVQLPNWWHQQRIGLDWTYANNYNGLNRKVVVVDSGVEANHAWLRGRVVDQACFSQTLCPNGTTYQYGAGAGAPCTFAAGCDHGTHVAHIAAGQYGAARSAGIVAINASSRGTDTAGNPAPVFQDADLVNALWYAYNYVNPAPAAINMSIGGGTAYSGTCDGVNPTLAQWITALRNNRGTATVISSGNGNNAGGISYPSCISSAVAVGNSTLTAANGVDAVLGNTQYGSNSSNLVDLWAPGTDICSAVPGNGFDCTKYGTSMAAPQVAGAFAVMKAARPSYNVTQTLGALQRNGVRLTDSRNGVTRSRLYIANAVYYG